MLLFSIVVHYMDLLFILYALLARKTLLPRIWRIRPNILHITESWNRPLLLLLLLSKVHLSTHLFWNDQLTFLLIYCRCAWCSRFQLLLLFPNLSLLQIGDRWLAMMVMMILPAIVCEIQSLWIGSGLQIACIYFLLVLILIYK